MKYLHSKKWLRKEAQKQVLKGGRDIVLEAIHFNMAQNNHEGDIVDIMKLYDLADDSLRLSFTYYIGGGYYTEYLDNFDGDLCMIDKLKEYGKKLYDTKVSNYSFQWAN